LGHAFSTWVYYMASYGVFHRFVQVKLCYNGLVFRLESIFNIAPAAAALQNDACFKSCQNQLKNNDISLCKSKSVTHSVFLKQLHWYAWTKIITLPCGKYTC